MLTKIGTIWERLLSEFAGKKPLNMLERKSNEDQKLEMFLNYAKELGRVPHLFETSGRIRGINNYYYKFRKIAIVNGLVYNPIKRSGRPRKYTEEQLLGHLRQLAAKLGHTPSQVEIKKAGEYKISVYMTCFGSIAKAQQLAGLIPNQKYNSIENASRNKARVTKEKCIEDLKRIYTELGSFPSLKQLKKHGKYHFRRYYNHLGGIKRIKEMPEFKVA
jgi:hypothetical protein